MSVAVWWKDYVSDDHLRRSIVHHAWVVETDLAVPALRHVDVIGRRLAFERLPGRHAVASDDLALVAADLGRWHARLARRELVNVEADASLPIDGGELHGFLAVRAEPLSGANAPGAIVTPADIPTLAALAAGATTGVYKDVNVRNVLLDGGVVRHVDVDDVTLAPAGYDLGKLLLSWAMTHGRRPAIEDVLDCYNTAAGQELCDREHLAVWLELHYVLTYRYRAAGHYAHGWPSLRTVADETRARALLGSS